MNHPPITRVRPWHRLYLTRVISARPRLFLSALLGLLVVELLPQTLVQRDVTRLLIGWNAGAWLYLMLVMRMMFWSTPEKMRHRARIEDEGRLAVLTLVLLAVVASLVAIVAELSTVRDLHGPVRSAHVALTVTTILSSWAMTHTVFAQHYAHDYYAALSRSEGGGLQFPGTDTPDYGDFLYFALIIGTSAQTADVSFTSCAMRRLGTLHCVLAFFFNTTLLALAINIASGLL